MQCGEKAPGLRQHSNTNQSVPATIPAQLASAPGARLRFSKAGTDIPHPLADPLARQGTSPQGPRPMLAASGRFSESG
jgi:hypothetical protein